MIFRNFLLIGLLFLSSSLAFSQNQYAIEVINRLTKPDFHGRGYYKNGDIKASAYIMKQFKGIGLSPYKNSYFQDFTFPVNTFPGKMKVTVNKTELVAGRDYIVSPDCPSLKGIFKVIRVVEPISQYSGQLYQNDFLLIDKSGMDSLSEKRIDSLLQNLPSAKGLIIIEPRKLTWSVSRSVADIPVIKIIKDALPENSENINVDIKNKFIENYETRNVLGLIPGKSKPDSFIVFTAHYDHLGRMGKNAIFPGANDNASGVAMILDLAKFYSLPANRPEKSLMFIAFAAEEAGLIGSKYYTENPKIPLSNMSFLINLDLMGNGQEGMMIVNGELHPDAFQKIDKINSDNKFLKTIGKRGKAKNSDHYWFSEKGVPAFFFYTMGGSPAYHDINDIATNISLPEFDDIKNLITKFVYDIGN